MFQICYLLLQLVEKLQYLSRGGGSKCIGRNSTNSNRLTGPRLSRPIICAKISFDPAWDGNGVAPNALTHHLQLQQ